MTISMYKVSVPIFAQFLTAQSDCIDKALAAFAAMGIAVADLEMCGLSRHGILSKKKKILVECRIVCRIV